MLILCWDDLPFGTACFSLLIMKWGVIGTGSHIVVLCALPYRSHRKVFLVVVALLEHWQITFL